MPKLDISTRTSLHNPLNESNWRTTKQAYMVDKLSVSKERIICEKALQQPLEMTVQGARQQRVLFPANCGL